MAGVFPLAFPSFSTVVAVFKKDSKLDYNDYRSFSLLSNIKKILEKKICIKGCIPSSVTIKLSITYSFGFRQRYSTSHASIDIIENIRKAFDDRNIGCKVFVDLQKAFDTVDHQILLAKVNPCGICGVLND